MTTKLILDTPEAQWALAQCYALLLRLAERRRKRAAADELRVCEAHNPAAASGDHESRRLAHSTAEEL